jgi:hypothetical protein
MLRHTTKRVAVVALGAAGAAALLAGASWATTQEQWDGGFPAGVVRLEVRAAEGRPVPGAAFRVYRADGQPSPGYPFFEPGGPTDAQGRLTVVQPHAGLQFGGRRWRLFWAIPMGVTGHPRFECEVAADGFRPVRVELFDLFAQARPTGQVATVDWPARATTTELAVYETTVFLEQ